MGLPAQNSYQPSAITIEDGLIFRDVNALAQDNRGLLWIGTDRGIDCYDGYRFIHLTKDKASDFFFPGAGVIDDGLLLLNDSTLWAVADYSLYSINPQTFAYELYEDIPGKIHQMRAGQDNTIWFTTQTATEDQLWRYHPVQRFTKVNAIPKAINGYTYLQIDTSGHAWWSTIREGLRCISAAGEVLHETILDTHDELGHLIHFTPLRIDGQNRIFICSRSKNEIWRYFPEQDSVAVVVSGLPSIVFSTYEDQSGNCWFGTKSSVVKVTSEQEVHAFDESLNRILDFSNITTFFADKSDLLWIGTNGGLLRLPQARDLFDHYLVSAGTGQGNGMRGICEDTLGNLYTYVEGGEVGIHRIEKESGKTTLLKLEDRPVDKFNVLDRAKHFFYDARYHCLWAFNTKLQRINLTASPSVTTIPFPADISYGTDPKVLHQCPDGRLLLAGLAKQLCFYDPAHQSWECIPNQLSPELEQATVKAIVQQGTDSLWVGTVDHGLLLLDANSGQLLQHYSTESSVALDNNHILSLHYDQHRGLLWIGTFGGGLHCLHLLTGGIRIYNENNGLPDNNIVSILPSDDQLWVGTYYGLAVFDYRTESFRNFFVEDGLSNNEFNFSSAFVDRDGKIYLGGLNGINALQPRQFSLEQKSVPLIWTGFQEYSHSSDSLYKHFMRGSALDTPLVIEPSISYFQLEWTLTDYTRPDKNQYYVLMDGIDRDWVFHGNRPGIRFNGLPAGEYRFRVKGRDNQGNWSLNELSIPIRVKAPLWRRWYSITVVLLFFIGLGYFIVRYRFQQRLRMEQIRTRIASDLHDEVGSMLSGLALQAEMLELQAENPDPTALEYLKNVSRQAVGKMRDLVWSIDSRRDNMHHLLDRMREFADETLSLAQKDYEFESVELPLQQKLAVDTRQHLYLIFREAITNCCKHSNGDHVKIFFGRRNGHLELSIHDNGTSPTATKSSSGLGLDNMRRRAAALNGQLTINNQDGFLVHLRV